ncbi:AAA family ATPase [Flavihumibacter profundi]|uniref:AAA family ATPase n=1 Tax=Flavihumibacter profundi TaxID=2716883 RepID=UPI001CC4F2FB|nr:AAA family ATPase [Flavihumibacter profundi]MBZ5859041.1 AAA family ATPase [Flavihumibacter profundi]
MVKKIVVLGPESTGKSTLCEQLANRYQTSWVPEFAREYLLKNGTDYSHEDLLTIAKGQIALEEMHTQKIVAEKRENPPLLFIDTDMYVMKVWSEFVFGNCHPYIIDQIVDRHYDLYLLCNTDIPWTKDELREYPDLITRQRLFHMYKDILVNQSTPWITISGAAGERLSQAEDAVKKFLL